MEVVGQTSTCECRPPQSGPNWQAHHPRAARTATNVTRASLSLSSENTRGYLLVTIVSLELLTSNSHPCLTVPTKPSRRSGMTDDRE
jgi:hypothetical protein